MPDLFLTWSDLILLVGLAAILYELNDLKKKVAALGTATGEMKGGKPG